MTSINEYDNINQFSAYRVKNHLNGLSGQIFTLQFKLSKLK